MNDHPTSDQLDAVLAALAAGDRDLADALAAMTPDEVAAAFEAAAPDAG